MRSDNPQCFWPALLMLGQTAEKLLVIHRSFPEQATALLASGGFVIHVFLFWLLLSSHLWKTVHSLMISFDQSLWDASPRMQKSLWYCSGHFSGPLCSRPSYSLLCIWSLTPWVMSWARALIFSFIFYKHSSQLYALSINGGLLGKVCFYALIPNKTWPLSVIYRHCFCASSCKILSLQSCCLLVLLCFINW